MKVPFWSVGESSEPFESSIGSYSIMLRNLGDMALNIFMNITQPFAAPQFLPVLSCRRALQVPKQNCRCLHIGGHVQFICFRDITKQVAMFKLISKNCTDRQNKVGEKEASIVWICGIHVVESKLVRWEMIFFGVSSLPSKSIAGQEDSPQQCADHDEPRPDPWWGHTGIHRDSMLQETPPCRQSRTVFVPVAASSCRCTNRTMTIT